MTKVQPYFLRHTTLSTHDGLDLPALWFTPNKKAKTAFIFLHGCGSSSVFYKAQKMGCFAEILAKQNIAFLAFSNRGAHYIKRFSKRLQNGEIEEVFLGTSYEEIEDCVLDIDAAISFVKENDIKNIVLLGESTGANKIVVYNHYRKNNPVSAYALIGAGDDQGLWANTFGLESWQQILSECQKNITNGNGDHLYSTDPMYGFLSFKSLYDVLNPNGSYNCFPFFEHFNKQKWSKNELFRFWKEIDTPTLILYGSEDAYCSVPAKKAAHLLYKIHPNQKIINTHVEPNADHSFSEHTIEEITDVLNWWNSINA